MTTRRPPNHQYRELPGHNNNNKGCVGDSSVKFRDVRRLFSYAALLLVGFALWAAQHRGLERFISTLHEDEATGIDEGSDRSGGQLRALQERVHRTLGSWFAPSDEAYYQYRAVAFPRSAPQSAVDDDDRHSGRVSDPPAKKTWERKWQRVAREGAGNQTVAKTPPASDLLVKESDIVYSGLPNPSRIIRFNESDPEYEAALQRAVEDSKYHRSPVVLEDYKLIFFTVEKVGSTVWKMLFHRMIGEELGTDWESLHISSKSKVKRLFHYNTTYASQIMTDPTWTRAIFVRNPHKRFLSAYLDKGLRNNSSYVKAACCDRLHSYTDCFRPSKRTLWHFMELTHHSCEKDGHWMPFTDLMEPKYWPYINFVGHMEPEKIQVYAEALLRKIGAWQEFGARGWGPNGTLPIFSQSITDGRAHHTDSDGQFYVHYNSKHVFDLVTQYYRRDYEHHKLGLEIPRWNTEEEERQEWLRKKKQMQLQEQERLERQRRREEKYQEEEQRQKKEEEQQQQEEKQQKPEKEPKLEKSGAATSKRRAR